MLPHVSQPKPHYNNKKRDLKASLQQFDIERKMENSKRKVPRGGTMFTLRFCAYSLSGKFIVLQCLVFLFFNRRITLGVFLMRRLSIFLPFLGSTFILKKRSNQKLLHFKWPFEPGKLMIYKLGLTAESKVNIRYNSTSIIVNGLKLLSTGS